MTICILAAGKGTRIGQKFPSTPKPLIPIFNEKVIDIQLKQFPQQAQFVLSLDPNSKNVQDYVESHHKERRILCIIETRPEKIFKGPAVSLLTCKDHLQKPFWLLFSDTLFFENLTEQSRNTIYVGDYKNEDPVRFCNVESDEKNFAVNIYDKVSLPRNNNIKPFIGLIYIKDYNVFFEALEKSINTSNDLQLTSGLEALIKSGLEVKRMPSWLDVGTPESYTASSSKRVEI